MRTRIKLSCWAILTLTSLAPFGNAEADSLAAVGSVNFSTFSVSPTTVHTGQTTGGGGLLLSEEVSAFALQLGVLYRPIGMNFSNLGVNHEYTAHYLEIPAMLRLNFLHVLSIGAGPYAAINLGNSGDATPVLNTSAVVADAGFVFGGGANLLVTQGIGILGDLRYDLGLANVSTDSVHSAHVRNFSLLVGLSFGI